MGRRVLTLLVWLLALASPAAAQSRPVPTLSEGFHDLFGPHGLVVNSGAALPAGPLPARPRASPGGGFTCRFDATTGTFIRTSQSFGPILTDRAETIGRGKFSFGYNYQFFSFDQLEGID